VAYKDPLNRRAKYLMDEQWMKLLQDTAWIVLCASWAANDEDVAIFQVNPRVVSMIGVYRAALDTRQQKTPGDLLVNFAKANTEKHEDSKTNTTKMALLELRALCNNI
jgi:hypothetical protein